MKRAFAITILASGVAQASTATAGDFKSDFYTAQSRGDTLAMAEILEANCGFSRPLPGTPEDEGNSHYPKPDVLESILFDDPDCAELRALIPEDVPSLGAWTYKLRVQAAVEGDPVEQLQMMLFHALDTKNYKPFEDLLRTLDQNDPRVKDIKNHFELNKEPAGAGSKEKPQ